MGSVERLETLKERSKNVRSSTGVSREMYICRPLKREFVGEEVNAVGCGRLVSGSAEVKTSRASSLVVVVSVEGISVSLVRDAIFEGRDASCFVVSLIGRGFEVG